MGESEIIWMSSVTQRIREIRQPHGGYIPPKKFLVKNRVDGIELKPNENIHYSLVGLTVDYMTRFIMGASPEDAFEISLLGALIINEKGKAETLLKGIHGLDDMSIANACKLTGYDVCCRASVEEYRPVQDIEPNKDTIFNIHTMINRSVEFWKEYGPLVKTGFTFEGGYTDIVSCGDGDYLTKDTIWDFKVSKNAPNSKHTLQLLMYYIMGCHSIHIEFQSVQSIGVFNPRLNSVYSLDVSQISPAVIDEVSEIVLDILMIGIS